MQWATGYAPRSFGGYGQTVGSSGVGGWTWDLQSSDTRGTATVTCALGRQTKRAVASFSIA